MLISRSTLSKRCSNRYSISERTFYHELLTKTTLNCLFTDDGFDPFGGEAGPAESSEDMFGGGAQEPQVSILSD